MVEYDWNTYKLDFSLPEDFEITTNTDEQFGAGNSNITISIEPNRSEYKWLDEHMINVITKYGTDYNLIAYENGIEHFSDMNGFYGAIGQFHYPDNSYDLMLILYIHPNDPNLSYYVTFVYNSDHYDTVNEMIMSIKPQ